ncbi:hypothetical protein D3C76_1581960 [compost metagenome]
MTGRKRQRPCRPQQLSLGIRLLPVVRCGFGFAAQPQHQVHHVDQIIIKRLFGPVLLLPGAVLLRGAQTEAARRLHPCLGLHI